MAYKRISIKSATKRRRQSTSKFERSEDWKLMQADIAKGFKSDTALQMVLTDEEKRRYNITNSRTVARFIRKYLKSNGLPYVLKSFHREDTGDIFIVRHPVSTARSNREG